MWTVGGGVLGTGRLWIKGSVSPVDIATKNKALNKSINIIGKRSGY